MHVVIAGGSGFLGGALAARLRPSRTVKILTRRPRPGAADDVGWTPDGSTGDWRGVVEGAEAVINLAGEGIADRRWTPARKAALRDSRLRATGSLVAAIDAASTPPRVLVSASGVNYYGAHGDERLEEDAPPGTDFLATLCVEWEGAAQAARARTRVVTVRNGVVLDASKGALPRMALPFKLGVGGRVGSGWQYLSWIHRTDWVELIVWLMEHDATGPFNGTAPEPVTNRDFSRALGRALHRPALFPVPGFALRLAVGELADMLLTGQRVVPAHALARGFRFRFPTIDAALSDLFAQR
jgi:uncharacterized protein (TIGR01777 family)